MTEIYINTLGLLDESDYVSLSPDLRLQENYLIDTVTGARHYIRSDAKAFFETLVKKEINVKLLFSTLHSNGLVVEQIADLIIFLNSIAGIKIFRSNRQRLVMTKNRIIDRLKGVMLKTHKFRYEPSSKNLIIAIHQSAVPLFAASLAVIFLVLGATTLPLPIIILCEVFFLSSITVSTFAHEAMHILVLQNGGSSVRIVRSGLRIGVLHQTNANNELISSICGPLAGLVSAVLLGLITIQIYPFLFWIGTTVGVFHLYSLLPWYGDGNTIKQRLITVR